MISLRRRIVQCLCILPSAGICLSSALVPENITELFPMDKEAVRLTFVAKGDEGPTLAKEPHYRILNYEGKEIARGQASIDDAGKVSVQAVLPAGFYELIFPEASSASPATGIWSLNRHSLLNVPASQVDSFSGIDAALSWLTKPEERPELIRNLRNVIGSSALVRERMAWQDIHVREDKWNWETKSAYESTRKMYAQAGIPLLEVFHNAPKRWGRSQGGRFPDDLLAASHSWSHLARRWHGYWGALEVWNEPDIGFGGHQPADQYLPLLKTIRYTMREAGIDTPIGGGVFATNGRAYISLAARNGLLDECDFVSFHYYGDPLGLERLIGQHRMWLAEFGQPHKPLWLTECGITRPGKSGVRPDREVQARTALTLAMQAVESRACGIERFFPFVYPAYSERSGSRHYGMVDHLRTPLRTLAASSQAAHVLSGTVYAGDLPEETAKDAKRFRVFEIPDNKESMLVVAYSGTVALGSMMKVPFPVQSAQGIDGRLLELADKQTFPIPDGIAYLKVAARDVKNLLVKDTEAMRLYQLAQKKSPPPPSATPIVLQPQMDMKSLSAVSSSGYFFPKEMTRIPVNVGVNNLGKDARRITLQAGASAPHKTITVAGGAREIVTMEVDVETLPAGFAETKQLDITATSDGGERVGPVVLLLNASGGWDIGRHLKESNYQYPLSLGEAYRWTKHSSGKLVFEHQAPATWGFRVDFPGGVDRWAYPRFTLPQEVDSARTTGVLLKARCANPATIRLMAWDDQGRQSYTPFSLFPADGEWHVVYVSYENFLQADVGKPMKISIGLNSKTESNILEVSDLYIIGK
ncbi:glycosyl hydrolase [Opitutaceae bacterium TAV4]|nr:glycosyl hydrolase [Opitutaceae bacterium TAV4]RRK01593.1 glycosyl hydrolase [Opitutaceae bacterium TAV3]RRK01646.1 glycosyl hydrolase [Opitutaceae bacterium TAV3]